MSATRPRAEVGVMRKVNGQTEERLDLNPDWVTADTALGNSENLVCLSTLVTATYSLSKGPKTSPPKI
ncbi:hypothetical protein SAMN04488118_10328 [Epibacterium ulvae]|uniref:Uncharacterized protein n=1 Tax=Epibacterium ulvae TaxID=1156985 RepID=A0A1G5Q604_9RHOB|nr:hypothetical protein SAMN04488118_10328 [Epibacterium ulvae]